MYMSNNNASKETIKFLYRKHHTSTHHLYPNDHVCMHVYVYADMNAGQQSMSTPHELSQRRHMHASSHGLTGHGDTSFRR